MDYITSKVLKKFGCSGLPRSQREEICDMLIDELGLKERSYATLYAALENPKTLESVKGIVEKYVECALCK